MQNNNEKKNREKIPLSKRTISQIRKNNFNNLLIY